KPRRSTGASAAPSSTSPSCRSKRPPSELSGSSRPAATGGSRRDGRLSGLRPRGPRRTGEADPDLALGAVAGDGRGGGARLLRRADAGVDHPARRGLGGRVQVEATSRKKRSTALGVLSLTTR